MRTLLPFLWCFGCSILLISLLPSCSRGTIPLTTIPHVQYGVASWYGPAFHGQPTASGEVYDMFQLTAVHNSAPFGTIVVVTNLDTDRTVHVRITDRGPFVGDRILDLSYAAARRLGMVEAGLARIRVEFLPETVPSTDFIVQAGAYTDQRNAAYVHRSLATQYPQVWITVAREGSQTFYRVRLGSFSSRAEAEHAARQVQALGYAASVYPMPRTSETSRRSVDRF
jgi:rare lipoprotein A